MPGMGGLQTVQALNNLPPLAQRRLAVILLVAACRCQELMPLAKLHGIEQVLAKPVDGADLLRTLTKPSEPQTGAPFAT